MFKSLFVETIKTDKLIKSSQPVTSLNTTKNHEEVNFKNCAIF